MINIKKLSKHIKEVGWKKFLEEYKEKREEILKEPLTALNLQRTGYLGVIAFSLVASIAFFWKGLWYVGFLFLFNIFIQSGQFISNRNQIKMFKGMEEQEKELREN